MEEKVLYLEDDEEEEEEDWALRVRQEVIEFILQRHGLLSTNDIAHVLDWKVKDVTRVLRNLENSGRVKRTKLGRGQVWTHMDEHHRNLMYY